MADSGDTPAAGSFDVTRARRDTPACARRVHFNNAGTSLPPLPVQRAVTEYLELESEVGGYEAEEDRAAELALAYDRIATLINAGRDEVAVVDSATRAWDTAAQALLRGHGGRVLTAESEYASNYIALLQLARERGLRIEVIPGDHHGQISIARLATALAADVRLIALTHVPTNGGLVNPAREVGELAREARVPYLLDVSQSIGQLPVDVEEIGCDLLAASGRKYLRGPRGTGFLYVRRALLDTLDPPMPDLHSAAWVARDRYELRGDARRFELFERSPALVAGLRAAVEYAQQWGMANIWARVRALGEALRARLGEVAGVTVQDCGAVRCGIVSFSASDTDHDGLRRELRARGFNLWVSRAASTRIDMENRGLASVMRASVHYYNTEQELDRLCTVLAELLGRSR